MAKRTAQARWDGNFTDGSGTMDFGGGAFGGPYSMALAFGLEQAGNSPDSVETAADVHLNPAEGWPVSKAVGAVGEITRDAELEG